jgi:hypothetical protein
VWPVNSVLGPVGWAGVVLGIAGGTMIRIAAPRADWALVAIGIVLCGVAAIVILRDARVQRARR